MPTNWCAPVSRVESEAHARTSPKSTILWTGVAAAEVVRDDVGGLQIAMEEPAVVRQLQRAAERRDDRLDLFRSGNGPRSAISWRRLRR